MPRTAKARRASSKRANLTEAYEESYEHGGPIALDAPVDDLEAALRAAEKDVGERFEIKRDRSKVNRTQSRNERHRAAALKLRVENEAKGIPYIKLADGRWRRACFGKNLYGQICGQVPLKKGKVLTLPNVEETCVATGGWCMNHDPGVTETFISAWRARMQGGRKRHVGPDEFLRQVVNSAIGLAFDGHFKALGVEIDPDTGEMKRSPDGPAKIYGESKDGDIYVTDMPDVEAMQKATERLVDRGFGKPRTQAEISVTPIGGATGTPPEGYKQRAAEVAAVLAESGAIPQDLQEVPDDDEEEMDEQ